MNNQEHGDLCQFIVTYVWLGRNGIVLLLHFHARNHYNYGMLVMEVLQKA